MEELDINVQPMWAIKPFGPTPVRIFVQTTAATGIATTTAHVRKGLVHPRFILT